MKTKIIRACDMIEISRKLLHDPELTLSAKGVAGTPVAFSDRDYSTAELAEESGTSENELIDGLEDKQAVTPTLKIRKETLWQLLTLLTISSLWRSAPMT